MAINSRKRINPTQMRAIRVELYDLLVEYGESITQLDGLIDDLDRMWDGDAEDKFHGKFKDDLPRYQRMANTMRAYIDALKNNADAYDRTEQAALDVIKR